MSPIALKIRLERAMNHQDGESHHHATKLHSGSSPFRSVSIGSELELPMELQFPTATAITSLSKKEEKPLYENDAIEILLSMSSLVSNEMKTNACCLDDDEDTESNMKNNYDDVNTRFCSSPTVVQSDNDLFQWSRVRTVSIDSPPRSLQGLVGNPAIVTPTNNRPLRKSHNTHRMSHKAKRAHLHNKIPKMPQLQVKTSVIDHKKKAIQACVAKGRTMKRIMRKKFSWKNYPGMFPWWHFIRTPSLSSLLTLPCLLLLFKTQN